jgi:hypothetical protein
MDSLELDGPPKRQAGPNGPVYENPFVLIPEILQKSLH